MSESTRPSFIEQGGIERYAESLAERFLADIQAGGEFGRLGSHSVEIAAHQLLWMRYMTTGDRRFGDAVVRSLRTLCHSALEGPISGFCLAEYARLLELLTWVWRVDRRPELRRCAEAIAGWAIAEMRVPGLGFAASAGIDGRDETVSADCNGLMIVALIEAGSVFERRDWLVLVREVFDEVAAALVDGCAPRPGVADGARGAPDRLDDYAMMSRAAIRLFEAFGKRRYLDLAETWVAKMQDIARECTGDSTLAYGDALMTGVLARLHALTGTSGYAERLEKLVEAFSPVVERSGVAAATAIANVQTAARFVSIEVSGDPTRAETRALMRVALDCGLPDRLVLGPGAGSPGASSLARIRVGKHHLAPIGDAARLRVVLAPGGFQTELHASRIARNS